MLTVWPVSSLNCCRWGAEISRTSIELMAEKPEVEHARSEAVALALAVLLEVAESGQRGDVAVRRAA